MIPLRDGLNALHEETCIKVYNPIEKKLIAVYANCAKASHRLGLTPGRIHAKCSTKTKVFSPSLKLEVALRLSARKKEDDLLIQKTQNYQPL